MTFKDIVIGDRSIRKFQQKDLDKNDLLEIMNNVRFAHCGNNKQLLRYVVVTDNNICKKIANEVHYAALLDPSIGQPKENEEAKAYIAILAPSNSSRVQDIDTGIVAEVITASAYEKGIASCMMLNFNQNNINSILEIPCDYYVKMIISLGYPLISSSIEDINNDDTSYYVDDKNNYHVPKRKLDDLVIFK